MQEKDKHKLYSKEELLKLIKEGKDAPADMDEFDREALEGLKLVKNGDVLDKLNNEVDTIVEEEKRKKKTVYYFSAAASLLLLIGLIFLFKNSFTNKNEKPLALVEKPKEESVNNPSAPPQTETQPVKEDKEPEYKEEEKNKTTVVSKGKAEKQEDAQYHEAPVASAKAAKDVKDAENNISDETKPLGKGDVVTTTGAAANQGPPPNKQAEQSIVANETETTGNNIATTGGFTEGEKTKAKKNNAKSTQQPSQVIAGLSQADNSSTTVNTPVEEKTVREESLKKAGYYAYETDKDSRAKNYRAPTFISGDSTFADYAKQNLKISSPDKSGIITVSFMITKNGTAEKIEVTKPIPNCSVCSQDVINLIKSVKKWQPAMMDGKVIDTPKKISIQYN